MELLILGLFCIIGGLIGLAVKEFTLNNPKILLNKNAEERDRALSLLGTSIILFIMGVIMMISWFLG